MVDQALDVLFDIKLIGECIIVYFTLRKYAPEIKELFASDIEYLRNFFNRTKQKIRDFFNRRG